MGDPLLPGKYHVYRRDNIVVWADPDAIKQRLLIGAIPNLQPQNLTAEAILKQLQRRMLPEPYELVFDRPAIVAIVKQVNEKLQVVKLCNDDIVCSFRQTYHNPALTNWEEQVEEIRGMFPEHDIIAKREILIRTSQ